MPESNLPNTDSCKKTKQKNNNKKKTNTDVQKFSNADVLAHIITLKSCTIFIPLSIKNLSKRQKCTA